MIKVEAKMSRFLCFIYVTVLLLYSARCEDVVTEIGTGVAPVLTADQEFNVADPDMEKVLQILEDMAVTAQNNLNLVAANVILSSQDDPESIYDDMIKILIKITDSVKDSNNAYKFLKANGLERIIQQNLRADYDKLKTRTLILLKVLFDVAPTTTSAFIPLGVVDRVLDIFEKDNLALKAHSLDVLYAWLPDNPRVQARVMKIKGLAPFYEQVTKLDTSVIKTLLDLFNMILKEHLKAKNDVQRNVLDRDKIKFYERIGLLEHMATPVVCNGLLNIFTKTWSYTIDENDIIITVFDLVKNIKQFCLDTYRGKEIAKKLFIAYQAYLKEPDNLEYFESKGMNVTEISEVIDEYVAVLKVSVKDEM